MMRAVVLAAGKGTRMKSDLPKVLHELNGRPLLQYVTDSLKKAGVDEIILVVGYKADLVKEVMGTGFEYVLQKEQLGTGHAVLQAEGLLQGFDGSVVVACGDAPLISSASFQSLRKPFEDKRVRASILTMVLENPTGYGRIKKNDNGSVLEIVEEKDASFEEKKITEVNSGTYLFDAKMLFDGLKQVGNNNAQGEYYLPDVVKYINQCSMRVEAVPLTNALEGTGINSRSELEKVSELIK